MTSYAPGPWRGYTLQLQGKISRIVRSLAPPSLANVESDAEEPPSFDLEVSDDAVFQLIQAWRERTSYLPSELLLDPAWAMLLELFQAELQDRRVSLARLCKVSAVSRSSAVRWLDALQGHNLAVRRADPEDAHNELVVLTPKGSSALRRYFHHMVQANRSFGDQC